MVIPITPIDINKYYILPNSFFLCIFIINIYYSNSQFALNNILVFNRINFRGGNFATNKNGDLVIEYSCRNIRLFYGFKKDGTYYFNTTDYENIPSKIIDIDDSLVATRYEARNIFINILNDANKEYLFSTGGYSSTEIIDLESNSINIFDTEEMMGSVIDSKVFTLLDLGIDNKKEYVCIMSTYYRPIIKLIKFSFIDFNSYKIINQTTIENNGGGRIVSSFILDRYIFVFFLSNNNEYSINIYDFNLHLLNGDLKISQNYDPYHYSYGPYSYESGFFYKGILLQSDYFAFVYYERNYIIQITKIIIGENNSFSFLVKFNVDIYNYLNSYFQAIITLNDLIKINSNRFILITSLSDFQTIFIILFDIYNNYENMKIRIYNMNLNEYMLTKELSSIIYNDFLILSTTIISFSDYSSINTQHGTYEDLIDQYCFSIFMIFGYINSTNYILDISEFFLYNNTNSEANIINKFLENVVIDNNIFGYEVLEKIKLVNIPESIIFYNKNNTTKLSNGDILNKEYSFEPNLDVVKNDFFYYLEYQLMAREPDYEKFNSFSMEIINISSVDSYSFKDQKEFFKPQIFYGKSNKAKFRLCEDFCTCCMKNNSYIYHKNCGMCLPSTIPQTAIIPITGVPEPVEGFL